MAFVPQSTPLVPLSSTLRKTQGLLLPQLQIQAMISLWEEQDALFLIPFGPVCRSSTPVRDIKMAETPFSYQAPIHTQDILLQAQQALNMVALIAQPQLNYSRCSALGAEYQDYQGLLLPVPTYKTKVFLQGSRQLFPPPAPVQLQRFCSGRKKIVRMKSLELCLRGMIFSNRMWRKIPCIRELLKTVEIWVENN